MKFRSAMAWVYVSFAFLAPLPLMFNSCDGSSQAMLSIQYQCTQMVSSVEINSYLPVIRQVDRACDFLTETNILKCVDVACRSASGKPCEEFIKRESLFHYASFSDYIAEKKVGTVKIQKYEETGRPEQTITFSYDAQGLLIQQGSQTSSVVYDSWDSSGRPTHGFQTSWTKINGSSQSCDCSHLEVSRTLNDFDQMVIETLDATNAYCATANKEPCGSVPSDKGFSYALLKETTLYTQGIGKVNTSLSLVGVNSSQQQEELPISTTNWGSAQQICY